MVAIFQQHNPKGGNLTLDQDQINSRIVEPLKYYANFDLTKMEQDEDEEEKMQSDTYLNP